VSALLVGAAVLNQTPLDWRHNLDNVRGAITDARAMGVSVLCLPELCLTGYGCEDAFHSANTLRRAWSALMEVLPETRGMVVTVGLPVLHQNAVFNCAAFLADGQLVGLVAKRHLAGDGIHYEPRWFKAWPVGVVDTHPLPEGGTVPIGDLFFDVGGVRFGFEICEDAWVANRPGATLAGFGVDFILNPSASHFAFGKIEVRKRFVVEGSRAFGVTYLYANLLGNEAGRAIYDGGALIASGGTLLATGPRFSFRDRLLTTASIDLDATRMGQARSASYRPDLVGDNAACAKTAFAWADAGLDDNPAWNGVATSSSPFQSLSQGDEDIAAPKTFPHGEGSRCALDDRTSHNAGAAAPWEHGGFVKEEEFTRAEALALFDYLRKAKAGGFTLSLSGGADSAAVAALVRQAFAGALSELSPEEIRRKLAHLRDLPVALDAQTLTGLLLTTAYQPTENSGSVTREAARTIAVALGARHLELDVSAIHRGYVDLVEHAVGRRLDWATDDIALQNIQARVRSPGIWMLANLTGSLLLSTSNRSEAAVGYATMDGDTSGGLSPIAGIDKNFLRHWLRWMETTGPAGCGSIPALSVINRQEPTAELRPTGANQVDEQDLMPYDLLDAVERAAIRDKRAPVEVWQSMRQKFPRIPPAQLAIWVERFFRLWSRNQWKRERYAPSFHLDDENLDPKTWCRWPILSGGFEVELEELRRVAGSVPS
jgi:NAD+ synthase (glutamine-hydrolysing)